jgi:hypothetical protein
MRKKNEEKMVKKLVDEEKKVFSYAWQGDYS